MHLHQRNKFSRGSVFFPHLVRGRTIIQHHSVATFYSLDYIWERKENMSYCKVQGVGVEKRSEYYLFCCKKYFQILVSQRLMDTTKSRLH